MPKTPMEVSSTLLSSHAPLPCGGSRAPTPSADSAATPSPTPPAARTMYTTTAAMPASMMMPWMKSVIAVAR